MKKTDNETLLKEKNKIVLGNEVENKKKHLPEKKEKISIIKRVKCFFSGKKNESKPEEYENRNKTGIAGWALLILLLIPTTIYQYMRMGSRLNHASILILLCSVYALYFILSNCRKIIEFDNSNFLIRKLKLQKILIKLQQFAFKIYNLEIWQRFLIVISILVLGAFFL